MLAAVEGLLDGWPGTLLLVTHDRYLMERVTDHQFALIDGKLRHLPRGIDEYLELASAGTARGADAKKSEESATRPQTSPSEDAAGPSADGKRLSGGEIRALRKTMASNERKIETLKGKLETTRAEMVADPSDFRRAGRFPSSWRTCKCRSTPLRRNGSEAAETLGNDGGDRGRSFCHIISNVTEGTVPCHAVTNELSRRHPRRRLLRGSPTGRTRPGSRAPSDRLMP